MREVKLENRVLVGVFCFLVLVIVGLAVGIKIATKNAKEIPAQENAEGCYFDEDDNETVCESDEAVLREKQLVDESSRVEEAVWRLLDQEPVDVDAINKLYDDAVAKALELDRKDYIIVFANNRNRALLSKGLKREALDALLAIDFDLFLGPDQYRLYTKIIDLATELNDAEILNEYQALRAKVEEDYMVDYRNTEEAARRAAEKASAPDVNLDPDGAGREGE